MKVVLDTNIYIAAFATHGLCQAIMELCLDRHEIAVSQELLSEVRRNLVRKVKVPKEIAEEIISFIQSKAHLVNPALMDRSACRDPDDLKILGTALAFDADCLITGDQDLLVLGHIGRTKILNPRDFAQILKA